ncbi:MAG: carboxypeptidase regulatory-like domain-containing protein [Bryobacterales bacterium]|nr:carboxypeptidase regulatory-like domain-containing protein [Bryobacterales bacterium]
MRTGGSNSRRCFLGGLLSFSLFGAEKKKPEKEKKLSAVIAGTVFRDPGFAVSGAEIELMEVRADGKRGKSRRAVTDGRGEFAFAVPAVEQKYKVKASARGLQPEEKETASAPGARIDVFFTLKPATP